MMWVSIFMGTSPFQLHPESPAPRHSLSVHFKHAELLIPSQGEA